MWREHFCGKECNTRLDAFFNSMHEGVAFHQIVCDDKGTPVDYLFLEINHAFSRITGLVREDIIGKRVTEVIPDLEQYWVDTYGKVALTGEGTRFEYYSKYLDKHFNVSVFSPAKEQFVTVFTDISDLKNAAHLMKKHQVLFDNAQDIIFYADSEGNIIDANRNAVLSYGYSIDELKRINVQGLRDNATNELFKEQMEKSDKDGITFEGVHIKKDGTSFPVEVSVKSVMIDERRIRIHIVRDISERKIAEEKITYLANYDSLTGIPNRSFLMNELNLILENAKRGNFGFALMLFDIDKFKMINDVYGHSAGDAVLKETAKAVQEIIRKVDFVARLGGDEFVIIQPYINGQKEGSALAQRIIERFKTPIRLDNVELHVNLSIGIAVYPDDSTELDSLMSFSDKAMYKSKQSIGGTYEFYSNIKDPQPN